MLRPGSKSSCRVFFAELLQSDLFLRENGDGKLFLVTPTCAICDRLFGVGEVKEVERRENITRIKLFDLTATLNIYTNKTFYGLSNINVDVNALEKPLVAFVGSLHARKEKEGERGASTLILIEEFGVVNVTVRNGWVINTAKRTMERIEQLRSNLFLQRKGLSRELSFSVNAFACQRLFDPTFLKFVATALSHYAITDDRLDALGDIAVNAVKAIWEHYTKRAKETLLKMLENAEGKVLEYEELVEELKTKGLKEEWIEEVVNEVIEEGRCYEPEVGMLKMVKELQHDDYLCYEG